MNNQISFKQISLYIINTASAKGCIRKNQAFAVTEFFQNINQ